MLLLYIFIITLSSEEMIFLLLGLVETVRQSTQTNVRVSIDKPDFTVYNIKCEAATHIFIAVKTDVAFCLQLFIFYITEKYETSKFKGGIIIDTNISEKLIKNTIGNEKYEELVNLYGFSPEEIAASIKSLQSEGKPLKSMVELLAEVRPEDEKTGYTLDDKGFAELFTDFNHNYCRYNTTAKEWYFYDGVRWGIDECGMKVSQKVKAFHDDLLAYCSTIRDDRKRDNYRKAVEKYGQFRLRETLIRDSKDKYCISQTDLDSNKDLLNCKNVTLNLKTGEYYPHNSDDLISKVCNVKYNPEAKSELWEHFIDDIMQGDKDKIGYLQKLLGYALTADTSLECCFILYGSTTRNGKSTLVETISHMLGDYSLSMQPQTLAQRQNKDSRQASGDIARLKGCRFLNASEPPKRMVFDAALLKTLLGRDSITARNLYEREFTFTPEFKLFINTNYLPLIQDDTLFTSGRINVITFDRHFSPQEQDSNLKEKLRTEENLSGILNWCLEGLRKFREDGATPPEAIKNATSEYRLSSDKIADFIADCLVPSEKNCLAGTAYKRYQLWCEDNGYGTENKKNFFEDLKCKGIFAKSATVNGRSYKNIIKGYILKMEEEHYYQMNKIG